jgi:hypothetical protein
MGLDKGLELVRQEPRRNGNHMLVFQFCPSVQQVRLSHHTVHTCMSASQIGDGVHGVAYELRLVSLCGDDGVARS